MSRLPYKRLTIAVSILTFNCEYDDHIDINFGKWCNIIKK